MWNRHHDYFVDSEEGTITFGGFSNLGRPKRVFAVSDEVVNFLETHRNYRIVPLESGDFAKYRFGFASDAIPYMGYWGEVLKDIKGLYEAEKEAGNI